MRTIKKQPVRPALCAIACNRAAAAGETITALQTEHCKHILEATLKHKNFEGYLKT